MRLPPALYFVPIVLLASFAFPGAPGAQELQRLPAPARVFDGTATLSQAFIAELGRKLEEQDRAGTARIGVAIVATTAPESIEAYSLRLAEAWGVGRRGVDDGVLLLVAKDDRRMRIEVGYGLEGALPDARAREIIDQTIGPAFRAGDFEGGIAAGADAIALAIESGGGAQAPAEAAVQAVQADWTDRFSRRGFWADASYVWLAICGLVGLGCLYLKRHWWGTILPPILFAVPVGILAWFDAYFLEALLVLPLYWFAYFILRIFTEGGSGSGGGTYSSSSSGRDWSSSYSSSSGSSSSSSSSRSSSSSSSSRASYGGGSFGGGGASGSW